MSALSWATVLHLSAMPACSVPGMVPEFWPSVVRVESHYDPLALHDDTASRSYYPDTSAETEATARRLMAAGHSIGVGLSQLTAGSEARFFEKFGLSIRQALDPCTNMQAGARHFVNGALQRYNTGKTDSPAGQAYALRVINPSVTQSSPSNTDAALPKVARRDKPVSVIFWKPTVSMSQQ